MATVLSLSEWQAHKVQNPQSQADGWQSPRALRDALNQWVEQDYIRRCLPPLPDRTTNPHEYEKERLARIKELRLVMPPDYPGKATGQDWEIALTNAVR